MLSEKDQVFNLNKGGVMNPHQLASLSFGGMLFIREGLPVDVNDDLIKLTGWSRKEILTEKFLDRFIPDKKHRVLFRKSMENPTSPFEIQTVCKNGTLLPVEVESRKIICNNEIVNIIAIRDISDRKQTEDEITKLSVAVDQSANIILITKTNGQIEYVNRSFTKVTGYKPDEVIGKNPRILKSGIQSRSFYDNLWHTLKKGKQWKGVFQNRKKNGDIYWESAIITPVKNKNGEIVRYIAIKEDITKHKEAEQSLRESEEQYSSMVSNIPGVLYRCAMDHKRTIYYVTDAIKTLSGFDSKEFLNNRKRSFASLIHPEDRETVLNKIKSELSVEKQYTIEYKIITSDNSVKWVSDNGRPVYDDHGKVKWLDGFIFDISERINVLEELRRAKLLAEEANKAKSEFLANISHEIRTPLNTVLGFAELMENMTLDAVQMKYLNSIKSSGKSLMTLINDLLDLSKIEAGRINIQYASCNIKDLLDEIRDIFFLRSSQKGIEYNELIDSDFPTEILFDASRLRQILINLVGNAIKFTHEGHVDLVVKARSKKKKDNISTMLMVIEIKDTGIGIPPESYKVIFDSFRQQSQLDSRKYEGTGLGLAITKRLIEALDGKISFESEVGKGTTFSLVFPYVEYIQKRIAQSDKGQKKKAAIEMTGKKVEDVTMSPDRKDRDQTVVGKMNRDEYDDLLNIMEHRLFRKWKHFQSKKPLKEIKTFAQEIIKTGKRNKVRFIKEYGEELYLTIENFDIEEMQQKLEEFPNLIKNMKNIPHES